MEKVNKESIKKMVKRLKKITPKKIEMKSSIMYGVNVNITENGLLGMSTNGHMLFFDYENDNVKLTADVKVSATLPQSIVKVLNDNKIEDVCLGDRQCEVSYTNNSHEVIKKDYNHRKEFVIEEVYLPTEHLISYAEDLIEDVNASSVVNIPRKLCVEALKEIKDIQKSEDTDKTGIYSVKLSANHTFFELKNKFGIDVCTNGVDVVIKIQYLIDVLSLIETDTVNFYWKEKLESFVVTDCNNRIHAIIMPLRS